MSVKKVDRKDEARCEECLIRVDDRCDVEDPTREDHGERFWKPEHQSGKPDRKHTPEDSEEVELFPVGPPVKRGFGPFAKEPAAHSDDVLNILPARAKRIRAKKLLQGVWIFPHLFEEEIIKDVDKGGAEITERNARADPMGQAGNPGSSQKMHQTARPWGMGKLQGKPCQDQADEAHHHGEVDRDVEGAKPAINMARLIRLHVLGEEDASGPHLPLLPEVFSPPEDGMDPEDSEDGDEKGRHDDEGPVKDRLPVGVVVFCMGDPLDKVGIGLRVALAAGFHQSLG